MSRLILMMLIPFMGFAQGGPNGPPNPACSGPNPPPWCPDNPSVPIDNWWLMTILILSAMVLGYIYINKTDKLCTENI